MLSRVCNNEVLILSSVVLLFHPCRAGPPPPMEQHSWMFADTPALYQHPEERPFFPCGPADNHDLLPINLLPHDDSSPPWPRDPHIPHWFADETLNHWLDITPPTQSSSSTPAADTLTSLISPHQPASHPLPESGSSRPNVPEAADHESLSTATRNFNREIEIPLRPVAMKRTSRPTDERRFMQLSAKSSKQLQYGTESELKAFGWISVLGNIPQLQPFIPPHELDWVADRIQLWDITLSELILSNQFSAVGDGVKHRSWVLCKEICLRHGNLLAILTSLPTSKCAMLKLSESKAPEGLVFQEQTNLLNWLKDQVHNPPTKDDSEYLSLRSTIIDYLKSETDSEYKQTIRWEAVTYRQKAPSKLVSLQQAITTQAAIKILKAYLKSTNPEKWRDLFSDEGRFLRLFKYLKIVHGHNNFSKVRKWIPDWASAGFFPWKQPLNPHHQIKLKSLFQRVDPWNEYVMQTYFLDYDQSEKEIK